MPSVPWYNRHREIEPRVHKELTERAVNRIKFTLDKIISYGEIDDAYNRYRAEIGVHHDYFEVTNYDPAIDAVGTLLQNEDLSNTLTFLELIIDILWTTSGSSRENHSAEALLKFDGDLRRTLVEEGILLRLGPDHEEVTEYAKQLHHYHNRSENARVLAQQRGKIRHLHGISLSDLRNSATKRLLNPISNSDPSPKNNDGVTL